MVTDMSIWYVRNHCRQCTLLTQPCHLVCRNIFENRMNKRIVNCHLTFKWDSTTLWGWQPIRSTEIWYKYNTPVTLSEWNLREKLVSWIDCQWRRQCIPVDSCEIIKVSFYIVDISFHIIWMYLNIRAMSSIAFRLFLSFAKYNEAWFNSFGKPIESSIQWLL